MKDSSTEQKKTRYCDLCNGEDLATVCIWCHKQALREQKQKIRLWLKMVEYTIPMYKRGYILKEFDEVIKND